MKTFKQYFFESKLDTSTKYTDSDGTEHYMIQKPIGNDLNRFKPMYHRIGGPAVIEKFSNGKPLHMIWYIYGKKHREDGPAEIYYDPEGNVKTEIWYINNLEHRVGEPSSSYYINGVVNERVWMQKGVYFRENDLHTQEENITRRTKRWLIGEDGVLHRVNGKPANKIMFKDNIWRLEWFINDREIKGDELYSLIFSKLIENPKLFDEEELDELQKFSETCDRKIWQTVQKALNASQEDLDALSI